MSGLKATEQDRLYLSGAIHRMGERTGSAAERILSDIDTLLAENARLRAVAEAARRADVVIHFDLQRMVIFGPDYNQAVKDVGDALHEALAALEAP